MRILHLLNHTNRMNGHVHVAVDLSCAQVKSGHRVAVASGGGDFDALLAANGVETMLISHQRRPATLLKSLNSLSRLVWKMRPDHVHPHIIPCPHPPWPP